MGKAILFGLFLFFIISRGDIQNFDANAILVIAGFLVVFIGLIRIAFAILRYIWHKLTDRFKEPSTAAPSASEHSAVEKTVEPAVSDVQEAVPDQGDEAPVVPSTVTVQPAEPAQGAQTVRSDRTKRARRAEESEALREWRMHQLLERQHQSRMEAADEIAGAVMASYLLRKQSERNSQREAQRQEEQRDAEQAAASQDLPYAGFADDYGLDTDELDSDIFDDLDDDDFDDDLDFDDHDDIDEEGADYDDFGGDEDWR